MYPVDVNTNRAASRSIFSRFLDCDRNDKTAASLEQHCRIGDIKQLRRVVSKRNLDAYSDVVIPREQRESRDLLRQAPRSGSTLTVPTGHGFTDWKKPEQGLFVGKRWFMFNTVHRNVVILLSLSSSLATCFGAVGHSALSVTDLRCEYQTDPLGIDVAAPRLSWILESEVRGASPSAYRLLVARSRAALEAGQGDLWDSGKVPSSQNVHVVYRGKALISGQRCFWKVRVWDPQDRPSNWSEASWWEMGLLSQQDWRGQWIFDGRKDPTRDEDFYLEDPAPLFRKAFEIDRPVMRARLYISGLGYYTATLNGQPVGDHQLDPAWTVYSKRVFYSVYDLTDRLQTGLQCLGVSLGNGWYNPLPLRLWGGRNIRQELSVGRPRFIAQLQLDYEDGTTRTVATDSTWKMAQGPIRRNNIYLGEVVDARKSLPGWDTPSFDDTTWTGAAVAQAPGGRLVAQSLAPIKATETLKPHRVTEPNSGVTIFDMGINFTGWIRLHLDVPRGTELTLRFGELLYPDGTLNPMTSVCGQIKGTRKSKEGQSVPMGGPGAPEIAWQGDTYIARGDGPEVYTPSFAFHAFRYVELVGLPNPATRETLEGVRLQTALEPVGDFSCSNPLFNRIQQMCQRTFISNVMSVQSDCPHRERFGYGGDLVTTAEAFMMNYDMARFYAKTVWDWHDSARADGMLTDTAPFVGIQYCGVGWAMAHPLTQLELYRYYGDKRIIEQQYATSKRWFDRVASRTEDHIIQKGLSDHESLAKTPAPQLVTPLYCESARLLSRMAHILGREEESRHYSNLAQAIRSAYRDRFLDSNTGTFSPGTQAAQAFALYLNMVEPKDRATSLATLIEDINVKHKGHLSTGIFGTKYALNILSQENQAQVAYDLVNRTDFPSWGNMLARDATTLWEHWEYSDNTFSHNHPMFGSVSEWFYHWLGGIQPAPDAVGFNHIVVRPQFIKDLDWVRCTYRSIRGPIHSHWRREGNEIKLSLEIPVKSRATVTLPANATEVLEGSQPASRSPGVDLIKTHAGSSVFRVGSGQYKFSISL